MTNILTLSPFYVSLTWHSRSKLLSLHQLGKVVGKIHYSNMVQEKKLGSINTIISLFQHTRTSPCWVVYSPMSLNKVP